MTNTTIAITEDEDEDALSELQAIDAARREYEDDNIEEEIW
jgi:hypothetical protein